MSGQMGDRPVRRVDKEINGGKERMADMKEIVDFIEENIIGKTLFTKELVYQLENGALQGVYSDQISFSNLKSSQSGFQLDIMT